MPVAALVTYARQPHLNPDDLPLLSELDRLGWVGRAVRWDDPATRWADFDAVILRSCWDYHLRPVEFRRWLDTLEAGGVRLWNPVPVVRWNLDKGYLRDLVARDVAVPGTAWLEAGPAPDLHALLAEHGWARAVVKPRISVAGHQTWVTEGAHAGGDQARFAQLTAEGGVLVQEFVPEVVAAGELSLVYIGRSLATRSASGREAGTSACRNSLAARRSWPWRPPPHVPWQSARCRPCPDRGSTPVSMGWSVTTASW